MNIQAITSQSFRGIYVSPKFDKTPAQERVISEIKNALLNDKVVFDKKGHTLYQRLESKNKDIYLDRGMDRREISIWLGKMKTQNDGTTYFQEDFDFGSFSEKDMDKLLDSLREQEDIRESLSRRSVATAILMGILLAALKLLKE